MNVIIEKECNISLNFDEDIIINKVIEEAIDYVECPYECEVYVVLTNNEAIRGINKEQRNIDKATDVLSFPMLEFDFPGDFSKADDDITCFNPETGELILGDIIVSMDKVISQAEEYNHSTKRELAFLIAHSMLHLSGYDHILDDERIIMEQKQKEILDKLGITREYK